MRALLILMLAGAAVLAQGKNKKPVFEVPEAQKKPPPARRSFDRDALDRTIQRLAGWPSDRARKAAERLIVQKEKSLPLVLEVLVSAEPDDARLKPGAAYVVGRVGDKSHALTLLLVAAERTQQRHAAVFFESAWRLQPEQTVIEAFRFFHLAETTLRRQSTKFVLDRISRENLPGIHDLLDRRKSERSFTREIGLRLLDRLVETKQVGWDDAGPYFYRSLGDESPQVSSRAMRLLAGRHDPSNIKELNHLITKELSYWRQRSYSALALSLLSSAYKVQPFEPETLKTLRGAKGLEHPKETLARASAALALAQAALRTNDKALVKLLDREVPIVLIDAVGARRHHYRDFGSVMPLAYAMLRRITGQTFPDHAPAWAAWWRDNGRRFRAKRELIEIDADELGNLEIELTQPEEAGGARVRLTVIGKQKPTFLHGRAYAVPPEDLQRLADVLRGYGFFETGESDRASATRTAALVAMRVGDLDRMVAYDIGEGKSEIRDAIRQHVDDLAGRYAWQAWWDIDQQSSWQLFFAQSRKWFAEHTDPNERAERLRAMVAGSLNDLVEADDRLYAVRSVAALPGGGGALKPAEIEAIVKAVAAEREANEFLAATVELLVPDAGGEAAEKLIDALADKIGPTSRALLIRVCQGLPEDHVTRLATDSRWKVRRAAVGALANSEAEGAAAALRSRLADEEISVRAAAAEALARRKDPATLSTLAELASSTMAVVRQTAAYSYGLLGGREGRAGVLQLLYQDRNPEVRIRAIRGLEESGDVEAPRLILGVFKGESDLRVRAAAANALVKLETPELVNELTETLQLTDAMAPERVAIVAVLARFRSNKPLDMLRAVLAGDDQVSADAAALGLARRWEDASLIQLIRMIKNGARERTAVRHLQLLTSRSFENADFKRQAENYEGWATTHSTGNPRIWYRDALDERGYDVAPLGKWVAAKALGPVPDDAVPELLRALRDTDWYIQRNASFLLGARIGEDAPETITFSTSPADVETAIRACNDWWATVSQKNRAAKEG